LKIVHTEASCGWGGQEIRILTEARGLIARGHEVSLLCPAEAPILSEAARHGVPAQALPIGRKNLRGLLAMRRWLKARRVDIINTHSSTDSWLAALACLFSTDAPAIVRTRHISAAVPDNASTRWLYTRATRHIVTTGTKLKAQLVADNGFPAARITSVPTGIDTQRFCPADRASARRELGLDENARLIGIVATLRSWKGHEYLLDAFASLAAPDWQLLIVGDGPRRQALEDKVATMNLGQRVRFTGHQRNTERWLQALDIFCLPSYANEGVPQALLQAMLVGLPIVTTPVGSITEAIDDRQTGLIVPPRDTAALAQALSRLIAAPELAARLGAAACAKARVQFSLDTMLDRMEAVFASAVHKSAS